MIKKKRTVKYFFLGFFLVLALAALGAGILIVYLRGQGAETGNMPAAFAFSPGQDGLTHVTLLGNSYTIDLGFLNETSAALSRVKKFLGGFLPAGVYCGAFLIETLFGG